MLHIFRPLVPGLLRAVVTCLLLLWAQAVSSAEVLKKLEIQETYGAKIYEDVRILGQTDVGVKIAHSAGLTVIPYAKLPPELAQKYKPASKSEEPATTEPPKQTPAPDEAPAKLPVPEKPQLTSAGVAMSCFVIIKTDKGSGSGFIAKANGKTYVYTNAHVICGTWGALGSFSSRVTSVVTATGQKIPVPFEIELSETHDPNSRHGLEDVARFGVNDKNIEALQIESVAPADVSLGREVIAYGNSLGSGVVTELPGTIVGSAEDRCEVSCEIVPGNSGGPIITREGHHVVGISTYAEYGGKADIWSKETRFDKIRRFAIRPDKVQKWRKVQYTALQSSLAELNNFRRDSLSLAAACFLNPRDNRGGFDAPSEQHGDYIIKEVIIGGSKLPLGASIAGGIARVNDRLGKLSGTVAMSTVVPIFQEFFGNVIRASNTQVASLQGADRAPYLKQFFPDMIKERGLILDEFNKQAARFR